MNIYVEAQKKNIKKNFNGRVDSLLKELKINPETVLVKRNNELLTEEDKLSEKDNIELISVVSGG